MRVGNGQAVGADWTAGLERAVVEVVFVEGVEEVREAGIPVVDGTASIVIPVTGTVEEVTDRNVGLARGMLKVLGRSGAFIEGVGEILVDDGRVGTGAQVLTGTVVEVTDRTVGLARGMVKVSGRFVEGVEEVREEAITVVDAVRAIALALTMTAGETARGVEDGLVGPVGIRTSVVVPAQGATKSAVVET
jgi:hypothetical protein